VSGHIEITVKAEAQDPDTPPSLRGSRECPASKQKAASKKTAAAAGLLSVMLLLVAVGATLSGGWLLQSHADSGLVPAAFVTGVFFFISSVVVPLGVLREGGFEAEDKESRERDSRDLFWALGGIGDRTLRRLAWMNFKQLKTFTAIAQRQARTSYYVSVAAAAISLLTLAAGAAVAVGLSATTGKVAVGVLATAGSVLSGFFAKTFLKSYQTASRQMSYYYGQPLVHCYLMHAQWLASETREHSGNPKEIRRWQEIIDASIKASAKAQDHLLSMQNSDLDKRGAGSAGRKTPLDRESHQSPMLGKIESLLWANHK
jgi:TRADD-N domain-containing protein